MDTQVYRRLLLAVDFEGDCDWLVRRADRLRRLFGARLILLHVVEQVPATLEYLPLGYAGDITLPDDVALEEQLLADARARLDALAARLAVPDADRLVRVGPVAQTIRDTVEEVAADLAIVGDHAHHGLLGGFGSTSRAVLRQLGCDLLCVKVERDLERGEAGA